MALLEKKAFADLCGLKTKDLSNYEKRKKVEYTEGGLIDTSILKNQVFYALHRHKGNGAPVDFIVPDQPVPQPSKRKEQSRPIQDTAGKTDTKAAAKGQTAKAESAGRDDQEAVSSDTTIPAKKKSRSKAPVSQKSRQTGTATTDDRTSTDANSGASRSGDTSVAKHAASRKRVNNDDDDDEDDDVVMSTFIAENKYKAARAVKVQHEAELMKLKVAKVRGSVIPTELVMPVFLQHCQSILMAQKATDDEILSDIAHRYKIPPEDVAALRGKWTKDRNDAMDRAIEASEKSVDAILTNYIDEKI